MKKTILFIKWQNNYVCFNCHKSKYLLVNLCFDVTICFNSHYGFVNVQCQASFCFYKVNIFFWHHNLNKFVLSCLLNNTVTETIEFWFLDHLSTSLFFLLSYKSRGFGANPIIWWFTDYFNILFLSLGGTWAHHLGVAYICL